ncbi:hypothetical protein PF005_g20818 [Phytophthora fragariae]|uniref:Uncharacterized protein n=1 Tax=Phytophthora fragariae TaxID=53985 RepID=A0A6A3IUJ6_9STRA|nr:hypothetical protein PF003_g18375 [Phytophthora fragariae]KAE8897531.1 hypothetical protein PF003_g18376 [Phytophthora fragariae]KAE8927769.1 hypothetical protein PF009_g22069 [Phytophthora fragariae]KAE8985701.1 hypothetical protein PF011_g20281 [Phytophthora fragariae]KAE9084295.1 hypothetical protein PF007_g21571 [Phytophthora fragariae]
MRCLKLFLAAVRRNLSPVTEAAAAAAAATLATLQSCQREVSLSPAARASATLDARGGYN